MKKTQLKTVSGNVCRLIVYTPYPIARNHVDPVFYGFISQKH